MQTTQTTQTSQVFEFIGTAKDFAVAGVKLNGKLMDQVTVGALARHGLLEEAGFGQKPARGRTPTKYKAVSRPGMTFSMSEAFTAGVKTLTEVESSAVDSQPEQE